MTGKAKKIGAQNCFFYVPKLWEHTAWSGGLLVSTVGYGQSGPGSTPHGVTVCVLTWSQL